MVDRRKNQLAFDIPLPPSEERLLKRNLSPDPSGRNQPGLVVTRSGVPVWQVEQFRRSIGNPRQIAKEHGLKPSEVRAAIL